MMQLFRSSLNALEVIPKRARDRLFDGAGLLTHTGFRGVFSHIFPVSPFWKLPPTESTPQPYPCAQLLLNKQGSCGLLVFSPPSIEQEVPPHSQPKPAR